MAECFPFEEKKFTRRSMLGGAMMLGSGAAISTVFPAFTLTAADAAAESGPPNLVEKAAEAAGIMKEFSKDFLSNKAFQDLALNFDPASQDMALNPPPAPGAGAPGAGGLGGVARARIAETGALVQPNGDILYRIYAPNAKDVRIKFSEIRTGELVLTKQDDGVFQGRLAYNANNTGPLPSDVYIDGMLFLYPFMPIHWSAGYPHNFIEVPDTELNFMLLKDVPHGAMAREVYWSDVVKSWQRCIVYTPPGYQKSNQEYPVLYLQHGGGENEVVWGFCGHVNYIMDNLIAEGKAVPFVIVMNNGSVRGAADPRDASRNSGITFERVLIESCIPFIEKTYRVKTGKWNRGIAGLSMGAFQSCDIGFAHPELFGSIGTFTASMTRLGEENTTRPYMAVMNDPANPEKFGKNYKVYFRSTTPRENRPETFLMDDKICEKAGIDKLSGYHRILFPERVSKWNSWRLGFREFAQLLFK